MKTAEGLCNFAGGAMEYRENPAIKRVFRPGFVGKVRRKIGDEGPNHRVIRTVRGIGYVFAPESVAHG